MLLAHAIQLFLTFKSAKGLSAQSIEWYRYSLGRFSDWLGERELAQVNPLCIALWLSHLRERKTAKNQKLSTVTIEGNYRALSAFFNWCEGSSMVGKVPSPLGHGPNKEIERPIVDEPDMDYVSYEEYTTLSNAIDLGSWLDYRDWCLLGLMFWCGLRAGELLAMESKDLILPKKEAKIRRTKNHKARPAFLLDDLASGLMTYLDIRPTWEGPELWLAFNKARTGIAGALSKTGLRQMLVRRCRRAEIRFLHPHLFRHGFAMEFLNNGAEIKAVSTMLGHTTMRPTERHYAQWVDGPLRRVHQRIADRISGTE